MSDPEILVAPAMTRLAEQSAAPALPDPAAIWLRAQWLERRAVEQRALLPIAIAHQVAGIAASVALPGLAVWYWPAIQPFTELHWLLPLGVGVTLLAAAAVVFTAMPRDLPPESGGRP
ncbi:MAG: hypothetical protein HYX25_07145 [Candidatus Solibacter usitatus]|nr:hypothetical protein [Candidatus Solibacter usitatus]